MYNMDQIDFHNKIVELLRQEFWLYVNKTTISKPWAEICNTNVDQTLPIRREISSSMDKKLIENT